MGWLGIYGFEAAVTLVWHGQDVFRALTEAEIRELSTEELRSLSAPGRGMHPEFLRRVHNDYERLKWSGHRAPQKYLAIRYGVDQSTMSRWLSVVRL
jgi:hypothetical protein